MAIKIKRLIFSIKAFDQLIPAVEVRPRRVGGSVYQIPMEVSQDRGACACNALAY